MLIVGAPLVLAACGQGPTLQGAPQSPTVLVTSPRWAQSVAEQTAQDRAAGLTETIEQLRAQTSSGWVGRQDETTGYLAQLRGGTFAGEAAQTPEEVIDAFLATYATPLFGIPVEQLSFPGGAQDVPGTSLQPVALRGRQHVDGVPVVDGALTATITHRDGVGSLTMLGGRVFPNVAVPTDATLRPGQARRAAEQRSGRDSSAPGTASGTPELVVLPVGDAAALAYRVILVGAGVDGAAEEIFIDAHDGSILSRRPAQIGKLAASLSGAKAGALHQAPQGEPVPLTGQSPNGHELTASGLRQPDGTVLLRDTTTPAYDPATGQGAIETYDATGLTFNTADQLPGQLISDDDGRVEDTEAMAAHAFSRYVLDYFGQVFGRNSWDGQGGSLVSAVHFGRPHECNAFFSSNLVPPQMIYGESCIVDDTPLNFTDVDIDTAGHEITHGVIDTSSGLLYTGQSGAMNESFADYFGNIIGNAFNQRDTAELFEDGCQGFTEPTPVCEENPVGGLSLRYMLTGDTFADYLPILDPPAPYHSFLGISQDNGGVHLNSGVWNNAMWSIRSRLAQIDGTDGNTSARARAFDQVAYAAMDRYLTPTSGFIDARGALEQAAIDLGVDAVVLQVIREVFDLNRICAGCIPVEGPTVPVSAAPITQRQPVVSGDRVAWVQETTELGKAAATRIGGAEEAVEGQAETLTVALAGDAVITEEVDADRNSLIIRRVPGAPAETLDVIPEASALSTGGGEAAAWFDLGEFTLSHVDANGTVTSTALPAELAEDLGSAAPVNDYFSIATGGGTVAFSSVSGAVTVWRVGSDPQVLDRLDDPVLSLAVTGERLLVITGYHDSSFGFDLTGRALLYDLTTGESTTLSDTAIAMGAAISPEYAIWVDSVGALTGAVAERVGSSEETLPDTDLRLFSFATGQTYSLLSQRGQQGFPSVSGNRLVWQDSVNGGDDIYTAVIPAGL